MWTFSPFALVKGIVEIPPVHPHGVFTTKQRALAEARAEILKERLDEIEDEARESIIDDAVCNGDLGYCYDCDRGCCDDCDSLSEMADEGYEEGYYDALQGLENKTSGESYSDEVIALNLRREEEAHKKLEAEKKHQQ